MKKAFILIIALAFLIGSATFAWAGDISARPATGKNMPELRMTAEQKAKLAALRIQTLELKKEVIEQNLKDGVLTEEQAKKMKEKIDARIAALKSGKLDCGFHRKHSPKKKGPQQ